MAARPPQELLRYCRSPEGGAPLQALPRRRLLRERIGVTCAAIVVGGLSMGCPQLRDDTFGSASSTGGASAGFGSESLGAGTNAGGSGSAEGGTSGSGRAGSGSARAGASGGGASGAGSSGAASSGAGSGGGGSGGATALGNGGSGGASAPGLCTLGPFSTPELISSLALDGNLYGPTLSGDRLTLAFGRTIDGSEEDIFLAHRERLDGAFGPAVAASSINTTSSDGTPFLSVDALTVFFFSNRPGGIGNRDIYRATRSNTLADFGDVTLMDSLDGVDADHMPWMSEDELSVYFTSNRPASIEGSNIWTAQRLDRQDEFDPPVEVTELTSGGRDESPTLSADQLTIYFCSDRVGGPGSDDIWVATRPDRASGFGEPQPVPVVNDVTSDLNVGISSDGREMIFSSVRSGTRQLYRSLRSCL